MPFLAFFLNIRNLAEIVKILINKYVRMKEGK